MTSSVLRREPTAPRSSGAGAMLLGYSATLAANLGIFAVAMLAGDIVIAGLYAGLSVPVAVLILLNCLRAGLPVVNPLSIFVVVWMILVPLTAFGAPLMEPMSAYEAAICAGAGAIYSLGGLGVSLAATHRPSHSQVDRPTYQWANDGASRASMRRIADMLVLISIIALVANIALEGRLALFDVDATERKAVSQFVGYPLFSSLGTISLAAYAWLGKLRFGSGVLVVAFIGLQLLTAQRWVAILGLLLAGVILASSGAMSRQQLRRVFLLGGLVVAAFAAVAAFRGGSADQQRYFILTGLYTGDPAVLQATEIIRYFGMSQRNMTTVFGRDWDSSTALEYTLSPLLSLWVEAPTGLGTTVYGYTANNAISYMHADVGGFWPVLLFVFSLLIHVAYRRHQARKTFSSSFIWAVCAVGLIISFFAYVNAYAYWVILFPLIALAMESAAGRPSRGAVAGHSF